ncbi:hypothetical protein SFUMM280S_09983 [Streptomyces fumanus]
MSRGHTDVTVQVENPACPVSEVLERVAGKWAIGILVAAAKGPVRSPSWSAPSRASAAGCSR